MSKNPNTKRGMRSCSSRELNTGGSSTNKGKPLPNYLRASTSSCHDFCKYGRRRTEAEENNYFLLRSDKKFSHREEQHEITNSITDNRRKKLTVKPKSSSTNNKQKSRIRKEYASTSENEENQVLSISAGDQKKQQVVEMKTLSMSNSLSYMHKVNDEEYLLEKKTMKSSKSSPSLKHAVNGSIGDKTTHATFKFSHNIDLDSAEQSLEAHDAVSDSLKELQSESENRALKSLRKKLLEQENSDGMGVLEHKLLEFENVDMNSLHGNFLKPEKIVSELLQRELANQKLVRSNNAIKDFQEEKLQKLDGIGLHTLELKQNDRNLLKQENAEVDLHEQKLKKPENSDLDFLELNSDDDQSSQSAEEETEESMSVYSESTESEHGGKGSNENNENPNCESRRARRNAVVHPQGELSTPYKLKFKRGKIIEPQPESSGLRKLKFQRRRLVGLSITVGQSERKNFKSSEKIVEAIDPNPNAVQSVVLKHQDQEKKDRQGLFNSIIEETASKLVECRKSKVKALVGAFETVISLQESKPAFTV